MSPLRTPTKESYDGDANVDDDGGSDEFERYLADDWEPEYDEVEDDVDINAADNSTQGQNLLPEVELELSTPPAPDLSLNSELDKTTSIKLYTEEELTAEVERAVAEQRTQHDQVVTEKLEMEALLERVKIELKRVAAVSDQQRSDLKMMEDAFSKLKQRYEQSKEVVLKLKESDESSRSQLERVHDDNTRLAEQYTKLKAHAQEKLKRANAEIVRVRKLNEQQYTALTAKVLRQEFRANSLAQQLELSKKEVQTARLVVEELAQALEAEESADVDA